MINCPNCGGLNTEGSMVCGNCGFSFVNNNTNSVEINPMPSTNPTVDINYNEAPVDVNQNINNNTDFNTDINMNMNNNTDINTNNIQMPEPNYDDGPVKQTTPQNDLNQNVVVSEESNILVDSFIGKNVEKIKNIKFSIWAFLFGPMYLWYRKMYKLFGIIFVFNLIASLLLNAVNLSVVTIVISLGIDVFLGLKFKDLYLKHVNESVDKITNQNQGLPEEDLINLCSKKGGTTIIPMIVGGISVVALPIIVVLLLAVDSTTGYLDTSRSSVMIESARSTIEVVRNDIVSNGLKENSKTYSLDDLNNLLDNPLETSPYGENYSDVQVQVVKMMNNTYAYKICMIDEGSNGFGFTYENSLTSDSVLEGSAPGSCE